MKDVYPHVIDLLWTEASVAQTPISRQNRRRRIYNNPNPMHRAGVLAVHGVAGVAHRQVLKLLSRPYEEKGMQVIGSGYHATAVKSGADVFKIVRRTELMSRARQGDVAERLTSLIAITRACYADVAVESVVETINHPLTKRPVVAIIQPFIKGADAMLDGSESTIDQLQEFANSGLTEMLPLDLAPDIVGHGNILLVKNEHDPDSAGVIRLVDTVPLKNTGKPHIAFPHNLERLQALASAQFSTAG